jgi:hypothetical protein
MIRDAFRAVLAVAVMAAAAGILLELRFNLAAIDLAHRIAAAGQPGSWQPAGQPLQPEPMPPTGRLRRLGRAAIDVADAAMNVVR